MGATGYRLQSDLHGVTEIGDRNHYSIPVSLLNQSVIKMLPPEDPTFESYDGYYVVADM